MARSSANQLAQQLGKVPAAKVVTTKAAAQDDEDDADDLEDDAGSDDTGDDDEGAEDDSDDDKDDDSKDDDEDEDEYVPPTAEEWKKTQDALAKANKQAKQRRLELKALKESGATTPDLEEANQRADKYKGLLVKTAAENALREAGFTGPLKRYVKMLDLAELDVDEDGDIEGLEDQIEELKEEFEDVLKPKEEKPARRRRTGADGAPRTAATVEKSSAELLAERVSGRR